MIAFWSQSIKLWARFWEVGEIHPADTNDSGNQVLLLLLSIQGHGKAQRQLFDGKRTVGECLYPQTPNLTAMDDRNLLWNPALLIACYNSI